MVQEAEKLKNNCPLSLVVNSITMTLYLQTPFSIWVGSNFFIPRLVGRECYIIYSLKYQRCSCVQLLVKPSFVPYHRTNRECASLFRENSSVFNVCLLRKLSNPTNLTKPNMDQGSEERQAMGRLVKLGQLYDVRQDKVLVSILLYTLRTKYLVDR